MVEIRTRSPLRKRGKGLVGEGADSGDHPLRKVEICSCRRLLNPRGNQEFLADLSLELEVGRQIDWEGCIGVREDNLHAFSLPEIDTDLPTHHHLFGKGLGCHIIPAVGRKVPKEEASVLLGTGPSV